MDKLLLEPADASYSIQWPQNEVVRQELEGGPARYEADFDGGTFIVSATWVLDGSEYQYFGAFFRSEAGKGATPILVGLMLDGEVTEYVANFIPGSLQMGSKDGDVRIVTAQLEVRPPVTDDAFDSSLLDVIEASGGEIEEFLGLLEAVVNVDWPAA